MPPKRPTSDGGPCHDDTSSAQPRQIYPRPAVADRRGEGASGDPVYPSPLAASGAPCLRSALYESDFSGSLPLRSAFIQSVAPCLPDAPSSHSLLSTPSRSCIRRRRRQVVISTVVARVLRVTLSTLLPWRLRWLPASEAPFMRSDFSGSLPLRSAFIRIGGSLPLRCPILALSPSHLGRVFASKAAAVRSSSRRRRLRRE